MFCERCRRPFSYAVPKSDNPDQRLCVGCCEHLRAGGAWGPVSMSVSDEQIARLRAEAAEAGDDKQVAVCDQASEGDKRAVYLCALALREAVARVSP